MNSNPPQGTVLRIEDTFEGRKITIPKPNRKLGDFGGIAFLCFWLCGWAVAEMFVAGAVWNAIQNSKFDGSFWFVAAWLGGWTVGGVFAIKAVVSLARGEPHEVFLLSPSQITHRHKRTRTYQKHEITKIDLETAGGVHYLYFDVGADRIYIGEHVREPEREWLYGIIKEWRAT
jgi:hypothetical protein